MCHDGIWQGRIGRKAPTQHPKYSRLAKRRKTLQCAVCEVKCEVNIVVCNFTVEFHDVQRVKCLTKLPNSNCSASNQSLIRLQFVKPFRWLISDVYTKKSEETVAAIQMTIQYKTCSKRLHNIPRSARAHTLPLLTAPLRTVCWFAKTDFFVLEDQSIYFQIQNKITNPKYLPNIYNFWNFKYMLFDQTSLAHAVPGPGRWHRYCDLWTK